LKTCIQMALYKHRMDERIMANERWLATTIRAIGDDVVSTDRAGVVRDVNPMDEKLAAVQRRDAVGKALHDGVSIEEMSADRSLQR
ncbi:histidine kinase, partial [Oceanidesulfovibrio marinus]